MTLEFMQLLILLLSLCLLGVGCYMAWPPLGPIVVGFVLLAGLVWVRMRSITPIKRDEE